MADRRERIAPVVLHARVLSQLLGGYPRLMSIETKYVEANGVRFAYFEEGSGPLVLLLHGFPDTAHTWDAVRPALAAAGYRVLTPFMRGYAPTSLPADGEYGANALGADVLALIDALGDGDPAIVVGHDFGASAAYAAAGIDPSKIRFLVTVAVPHPASLRLTPGLLWGIRHFFTLSRRGAGKRVRKNDFALIDTLVRRWSPGWDVPAVETAKVKEVFARPDSLDAALGYYRAIGSKTPAAHQAKISVPTVAIGSERDGGTSLERARSRFTGSYDVVLMPGGHFLHRQHPERFIEELLGVLPPS